MPSWELYEENKGLSPTVKNNNIVLPFLVHLKNLTFML